MAKDTDPPASFSFVPSTDRQREAVALWRRSRVMFLIGPAGSGKTHVGLSLAIQEATKQRSRSKKILLSRPLVPCDEDMGFLPGSMEEKLGPWLAPFRDVASTAISGGGRDSWASLVRLLRDASCDLEPVPTGMLRGRTVSYGTLILDEAQNCTRGQLLCALTRVGSYGRVIVCADPQQSDRGGTPAILDVVGKLRHLDAVGVVEFAAEDCVRDPLVIEIVNALCE